MDGILGQVLDQTTNTAPQQNVTADFGRAGLVGEGGLDGTISNQWANRPDDERYTDPLALSAILADVKRETVHHDIKLGQIMPTLDNGQMKFKIQGLPGLVVPTNHAATQLFAKDGLDLPQRFIASCPPELAVRNVEHGRTLCASDREIRLNVRQQPGEDGLLRAVTSRQYGYIADYDVMDAVLNVLGDRWTVPVAFQHADVNFNPVVAKNPTKEQTTLYYGDRSMCLFFVDHTTVIEVAGRKYMRGFYVLNSEVGESKLIVRTFLLDFVCMNRNIWGQTALQVYERKHTKYAPQDFIAKVRPALESFANGTAVGIEDGIKAAMAVHVEEEEDQIGLLGLHFKLGLTDAKAVLQAVLDEEGHKAMNVWDLVQGTTAFARSIPNADNRLVLEQAVGKFMNKSFAN